MTARAYAACGGDSYARIDIRQDSVTGELIVLEVNSVCSIAVNSFFDLGLAPYGVTFQDFIRYLVEQADSKACC